MHRNPGSSPDRFRSAPVDPSPRLAAPLFFAAATLLLILASGLARPAHAHPSLASPPPDSTEAVVVADVEFRGSSPFSDETLALRVRTRPNRRFLGIPGFTWWQWIYELGASGSLGDRVGGALMASGEAPAYLDAGVVQADVERLRLFYLQEGFREAHVTVRIDTLEAGRRAEVVFLIEPGAPTYVRRVTYDGVDDLTPEQRARVLRGSLLRPEEGLAGTAVLGFETRGRRYSEPTLHQERRRLLTLLRDEGYASVTRDSIRALVYPQAPDSFDVVFRIRKGPRYRFGNLHFEVSGPEADAAPRGDTLQFAAPDASTPVGGRVSVHIENERKLDPDLLLRTLRMRPGDWYSQADVLATKRRLEATGIFLFTDLVPLVEDTVRVAHGAAPRLPHRIDLRTRRRHQIRMETFMLQRSSVVGSTGDELGTGLGLSYQNANLFGRGEAFRLRGTGSIATDMSNLFTGRRDSSGAAPSLDERLFTSAQGEVSASLTYPYLFGPFRSLERSLHLYDARTRLALSYLTARRADLGLIIRGRGSARFRLEMQHTPTVSSLVDVLDLSLSNPDADSSFLADLLAPVQDDVQRAQILEDYTQPQVNSALRYTLRSARVNLLTRERGYSYEGGVEVGGNLMYLLDRFAFTPEELEGSLPGLPIFREGGTGGRLVYRQYVRAVTDLRRYRPVDRHVVLALKFIGGLAHPTGQADVVPFDRRFFSGGSSSVRGWGLRDLGPGATDVALADLAVTGGAPGSVSNILGGEVKLEASAEARARLVRNVLAADWIGVVFADAGNVWLGPRNPGFGRDDGPDGRFRLDRFYRELGVGTGMGLRLAWEYLIVRFDLAAKLFDPSRSGEGLFPDGLRRLQPHFGIGHTF